MRLKKEGREMPYSINSRVSKQWSEQEDVIFVCYNVGFISYI